VFHREQADGTVNGQGTDAMGLDPALGLMHADTRYRGSLASDLMEPVRPIVDRLVLELLTGRELARGDVVETREGVCRLGPDLARQLAAHADLLRTTVVPEARSTRTHACVSSGSIDTTRLDTPTAYDSASRPGWFRVRSA